MCCLSIWFKYAIELQKNNNWNSIFYRRAYLILKIKLYYKNNQTVEIIIPDFFIAMKNITSKAEGLLEEKKNAATTLLEKQVCSYYYGRAQ